MGKISDEVWNMITSSEGDIQETVESVYNRILNPGIEKKVTSDPALGNNENCINQENEPDEPPGFALPAKNNERENFKQNVENDVSPPGFASDEDVNQVANGPDEDDLDAPPGFC
jgi:hypothetical protein